MLAVTSPDQWEYLTKYGLRDKDLRKLGEQGWELVSTAASTTIAAGWGNSITAFYFKRRL